MLNEALKYVPYEEALEFSESLGAREQFVDMMKCLGSLIRDKVLESVYFYPAKGYLLVDIFMDDFTLRPIQSFSRMSTAVLDYILAQGRPDNLKICMRFISNGRFYDSR